MGCPQHCARKEPLRSMNEAFITIVGFIVLGLFIYSAFSEKINVQFAFIIFPVVGAVVLGVGFDELKEWMIKGIENNASIIGFVVFTCSFFQLMNDVGAFDGIVDFIIERSGSTHSNAWICASKPSH